MAILTYIMSFFNSSEKEDEVEVVELTIDDVISQISSLKEGNKWDLHDINDNYVSGSFYKSGHIKLMTSSSLIDIPITEILQKESIFTVKKDKGKEISRVVFLGSIFNTQSKFVINFNNHNDNDNDKHIAVCFLYGLYELYSNPQFELLSQYWM